MESPQLTGNDKTICAECVSDKALCNLVNGNLSSSVCSYCGEESEDGHLIAAPYDLIMQRVYDSIFMYYADAQDTDMPWVEKEWLMPEANIWEVVDEFDPGWNHEFVEDLVDSCDPNLYLVQHVNNDWALENPHSALAYGWTTFKEHILYKTRYLFLSEPEDEYSSGRPDYIPISKMLDALGYLCNKENLIKKIPAGTEFYRVRARRKGEEFGEFSDIGVPPKGIASAGRMNPAGISYFYLAYDQDTAEKEVITFAKKWSIAKFSTKSDIMVIDFVSIPDIPSLFEPEKYDTRNNMLFLVKLVNELTLPVSKDGSEHIDYVPTQVVSEYFRYRFKTENKESVLGIRYPSVKNGGGVNLAIFESDNEMLKKYFELESIENNC